jgi:hypothetical protein
MSAENLAPTGIRSLKRPARIVTVPTELFLPTTISYSLAVFYFASYNHETEQLSLLRRYTVAGRVSPFFAQRLNYSAVPLWEAQNLIMKLSAFSITQAGTILFENQNCLHSPLHRQGPYCLRTKNPDTWFHYAEDKHLTHHSPIEVEYCHSWQPVVISY